MDLIDLYHRRGIALVRSQLRATAAARRGYGRLARVYSEQIDDAGRAGADTRAVARLIIVSSRRAKRNNPRLREVDRCARDEGI